MTLALLPSRHSKRWKRRVTQIMLVLLLGGVTAVTIAWLVAMFQFRGPDHSTYDQPRPLPVSPEPAESPEHVALARSISEAMANPPTGDRQQLLRMMRKQLDDRGEATMIQATVCPVDSGGIKGEWVVAPNVIPGRRLLYIHGGAYVAGSAKSHRPLASRFSAVSQASVLCLDYRLMPEHTRMDGINDCRAAYQWILSNGPDGQALLDVLIVAGDSSGGNLALSTIAWARDQQLRRAEAVVVLCPQTDSTLASPSLRTNVDSDIMQGKTFGPVVHAPQAVSLWIMYLMHRISPSSPLISPLLGDLSHLPPTLLQVSEAEMFLDDSVRYANKAKAQGSVAVIQMRPKMIHVWQAFEIPEAAEAFDAIQEFLKVHAPAVNNQAM